MKGYNGWAGFIRDIRGTVFYDEGFAKVTKTSVCAMCGQENDGSVSLSYHAEDYGHTWEEYVAQCKCVCPRCHGMIHTRFKFPNRWARYKHQVRDGKQGGFKKFSTLREFFSFVGPVPDIEETDWLGVPTGVPWIDAIPLHAYAGETKLATAIFNGVEVPDSKVYNSKWDIVSGVIIRDGVATQKVFHQPAPGVWVSDPQPELF